MKLLVLLLAALLSGCASLTPREQAYAGAGLDAASTAVAVGMMGATELNPIGAPATILAKPILIEICNREPEPIRTDCLTKQGAIWGGVGTANIASLLLSSNPAGWIIGTGIGVYLWNRGEDEREFQRICQYVFQVIDKREPGTYTCIYNKARQ